DGMLYNFKKSYRYFLNDMGEGQEMKEKKVYKYSDEEHYKLLEYQYLFHLHLLSFPSHEIRYNDLFSDVGDTIPGKNDVETLGPISRAHLMIGFHITCGPIARRQIAVAKHL
ncbi:hypothetical protein ACJX0J_031593, partial [Zea mays]